MRSTKANRIPVFGFGARQWLALAGACAALGAALTFCCCKSVSPSHQPKTPAGYDADTTPGRDGSDWLGGELK
jgi:hypothetical protein